MRLIDADKILEYLDEETYSTNRAFASAIVQSLVNEIITPQPTVNAIVIPPNATNGDVMMMVFKEIQYYSDGKICANWWNEEYKQAAEGETNGSIFEKATRKK